MIPVTLVAARALAGCDDVRIPFVVLCPPGKQHQSPSPARSISLIGVTSRGY